MTTAVWSEFDVPAPAHEYGAVLRRVVGPLIRDARRAGVAECGLFLRSLANTPDATVTVQLRHRPGADLAGWPGIPTAGVRPAELVPLAGSAFGGACLAGLTREFLAGLTPTLLDVAGRDPADRSGLLVDALTIMIAHLSAVGASTAPGAAELGVPVSFLSFRSHSEAFLASSRDPDAARRALDRQYERVGGTVRRLLPELLARLDAGEETGYPAASAWYSAIRTAKPRAMAAFRDGTLTTGSPDQPGDGETFASSFHRTVAASTGLRHYLQREPAFLAVRLLTSMLYLCLHNVGVSLMERYFLCHAISRACESEFEVDAVELLAALADRQPAT